MNPGVAVDAMTITFPQPIVNGRAIDIVIFEINTSRPPTLSISRSTA